MTDNGRDLLELVEHVMGLVVRGEDCICLLCILACNMLRSD